MLRTATRFAVGYIVTCSFVTFSFASICTKTLAQTAEANSVSVPPPLRSVIGELRLSKTPVLLPTWLPPLGTCKYPAVGGGYWEDGYEVWIGLKPSASDYETGFYVHAGKGTPQKSKHVVNLDGGRVAYVSFKSGTRFIDIQWKSGAYCYGLGLRNNGPKSEQDLIRCARSMTLISARQMQAAPKGEDRLVKEYASQEETRENSRRVKIGQEYDEAVNAFSRGDIAKAESAFKDVIQGWVKCYEIPPLAQVQLAYAQLLRKAGRAQEAAEIEKHYLPEAASLEDKLKSDMVDAERRVHSSAPGSGDYTTSRNFLSKEQDDLARLYFALGRNDEAEALFKKSFHNELSAYGPQCADLKDIANHYTCLLLSTGRSTADADELMNPGAAADADFRRGTDLLNSGNRQEAIDQFKNAVRLRTDFANAWYNLGELYAATGNLEEAKRSLKSYLELVPAGTRADGAKVQITYFDTIASKSAQSNNASDYLDQLQPNETARWPATRLALKVCIIPGDKVSGYKPEYKAELLEAFQSWSKASDGGISFNYIDDPKAADIAVGWSNDAALASHQDESGDCRLTLEPGKEEIKRAFILLLTNPPLVKMSAIQEWNVSLHEIGHALGIYGHSGNPSDVMYFFSLPDNRRHSLSERDIKTLKKLYTPQ